jgi:urea transport system permease protein
MVSLSEFGAIFAMQGFNGLSVFCVLLLMALGLAIIFGQMGVINMAHGEFMTIGAYITYLLSHLTTTAPAAAVLLLRGHRAPSPWPWRGLAGGVGLIRRLYKRPLDTLLATWGLSLAMQQTFRSIFGAKEVSATLPDWLMGSFKPTDAIDIPINGLFMMGLTVLLTGPSSCCCSARAGACRCAPRCRTG